ncbi:MAG: PqqD family protein [Elusimicrobiota bacterium]
MNQYQRLILRSKMEWVVEREGCDPSDDGPERGEVRDMRLAPHVKFREEKFGGVLFETRSERVFTLTRTGVAVVREIVAGADSRTLVEKLKSRYKDPEGKLQKDAESLIAELKDKGLIVD